MTPDEIKALLARARAAGLVRDSYPMLDDTDAERLHFLLTIASRNLQMEEHIADYDQLRLVGPDEPRKAAIAKHGEWHLPNGWKDELPSWIAKLEKIVNEAA